MWNKTEAVTEETSHVDEQKPTSTDLQIYRPLDWQFISKYNSMKYSYQSSVYRRTLDTKITLYVNVKHVLWFI